MVAAAGEGEATEDTSGVGLGVVSGKSTVFPQKGQNLAPGFKGFEQVTQLEPVPDVPEYEGSFEEEAARLGGTEPAVVRVEAGAGVAEVVEVGAEGVAEFEVDEVEEPRGEGEGTEVVGVESDGSPAVRPQKGQNLAPVLKNFPHPAQNTI